MKWKNVLKNVIFALMLASSLGFFKWWGTSCRADRDLQHLTGWRVENAPPLFECRVVNPMETFASVFSCPCSDVLPGGKWISLSAKLNLICWFMFYMHIPQNPCFCYNRLTCLLSSKWYFLGKNKKKRTIKKSKSLAWDLASQLKDSCQCQGNANTFWPFQQWPTTAVCTRMRSCCYF